MVTRRFEVCRSEDQSSLSGRLGPFKLIGTHQIPLLKVGTSKFKPWCTRRLGHLPRFGKSGGLRPSTCSYIIYQSRGKTEGANKQKCRKICQTKLPQDRCGCISDCRSNKRQRNHGTSNSAGLLTLSPRVTWCVHELWHFLRGKTGRAAGWMTSLTLCMGRIAEWNSD